VVADVVKVEIAEGDIVKTDVIVTLWVTIALTSPVGSWHDADLQFRLAIALEISPLIIPPATRPIAAPTERLSGLNRETTTARGSTLYPRIGSGLVRWDRTPAPEPK